MATGTKIDSLYASFGADFKELLSEMKKAEKATGQFRQKVAKDMDGAKAAFDKIGARIKGVVLGALAGLSVTKLTQMTRATLQWADDTATLADRLGVTTEELQALIFAGRELNVTSQQMAAGLQSFWAKVSEAATGKGEALPVLRALGIDPGSLKNADQALTVIGAKLREFDKQSQLSVSKSLFGDEKAAQFLALLVGDLDKFKQKAREAGVVLDDALVRKGEALNKEFERITDQIGADLKSALIELGPVLVDILRMIRDIGRAINDAVRNARRGAEDAIFNQKDPAMRELIRRSAFGRKLLSDRAAVEQAAAADLMALPNVPAETPKGKRRLNHDSAAASAMEQFEKQIQKMRTAALALQHELRFDKATAANVAALEAFATAAGKIKPTADQMKRFSAALKEVEAAKTALAFKQFADENERLAQIVAAEVAGNRELVAVLEERFRIEDMLGRKLTEQEAARSEALARTRFQLEETRARAAAAQSELESLFDGFASSALGAFDDILSKQKTVGEAMRDFWLGVLRDIANEMIKLSIINPLKNAAFGQNNPTFGDIFGLLGGLGGAASGAGSWGIWGFADGGRPPVGMPSLVGERGPELFVPDTAGTIVPNGRFGGTVNLYGSDSDKVEIGQLKAGLRQLGIRVNQVQGSIAPVAVAAVSDARQRGIR